MDKHAEKEIVLFFGNLFDDFVVIWIQEGEIDIYNKDDHSADADNATVLYTMTEGYFGDNMA